MVHQLYRFLKYIEYKYLLKNWLKKGQSLYTMILFRYPNQHTEDKLLILQIKIKFELVNSPSVSLVEHCAIQTYSVWHRYSQVIRIQSLRNFYS